MEKITGKISDIRHLDLKIEYYTTKAATGAMSLDDTYLLAKYKILRQLLILIKKVDGYLTGTINKGELLNLGGIDGLKKAATTMQMLMMTFNTEQDRASSNKESAGTIIQFDKNLKLFNKKLKQL